MNLHSNFAVAGEDLAGFEAAIKEMTDSTHFVEVSGSDLMALVHLADEDNDCMKVAGVAAGRLHRTESEMAFWTKQSDQKFVNVGQLDCRIVDKDLAKESFAENGFVLVQGTTVYAVAGSARSTLLMRTKLDCDFMTNASIWNTIALTHALTEKNPTMTMVVRENKKSSGFRDRKAFAFLTPKYSPVPISILPRLVSGLDQTKLGRVVVKAWTLDHEFAKIWLEFPELGKDLSKNLPHEWVPGLMLQSSDTGASSLIARSTWRQKNRISSVILDEYMRKHVGAVTTESALEDIDQDVIKLIPRLTEALTEKMSKIVGLPIVATDAEKKKNLMIIEAAYKAVFKKLEVKKLLGKDRTERLLEDLMSKVDPGQPLTEYDMAISVMAMGENVSDLSSDQQERLAKIVGGMPFISCEPVLKKAQKALEAAKQTEDGAEEKGGEAA